MNDLANFAMDAHGGKQVLTMGNRTTWRRGIVLTPAVVFYCF
jgi:hypothetical protein